jgi:hypothetical protein
VSHFIQKDIILQQDRPFLPNSESCRLAVHRVTMASRQHARTLQLLLAMELSGNFAHFIFSSKFD